MPTYIGVDGGGTKTEVLVMSGTRGASVRAPSSNPQSVGWDQAERVVIQAIDDGLHALSLKREDVAGLSVCMAGVDRVEETHRLRSVFGAQFPHTAVEITNDALAALTAGTKGQPGIVLIAGTGSIAVGESADGRISRAGGYGYLLGDEGSGFAIGRAGLMAAIQSFEGRTATTKLWQQAAAAYGVTHPSQLIPAVYESAHPVSTIARFAKEVLSLAAGDEVAAEIVSAAVGDYIKLIEAVSALVYGCSGTVNNNHRDLAAQPTVVLAGGLFTNTDVLGCRLRAAQPSVHFRPLASSGASGATLRAIHEAYRHPQMRTGLGTIALDMAEAVAQWNMNIELWQQVDRATSATPSLVLYGAGSIA